MWEWIEKEIRTTWRHFGQKKEEKSKKNNNNPRKRKLAAEIIIFGEKKIKINISIVCVVCERVFALSENCENIAKKNNFLFLINKNKNKY